MKKTKTFNGLVNTAVDVVYGLVRLLVRLLTQLEQTLARLKNKNAAVRKHPFR